MNQFYRLSFAAAIGSCLAMLACSDESSTRPGTSAGGGGSVATGATSAGGATGSGGAVGASGSGPTASGTTGGGAGATSSGGGGIDGTGGRSGGAGNGGREAGTAGGAGGGGDAGVDCVVGSGVTDLDANTARDNKTCLVWQKMPTCSGAWKAVAQCCQDLTQGGFDDWRMPTVAELFTWAKPATNAEYMTCPAYVKPGAGDPANNFEYCTVTTYSAVTCAHRGQATTSPTFCVRGRGQNVATVNTETTCSAPCGLASENVYLDCMP